MIVLQNDNLGRILHNALYQRMYIFAQQVTPEVPPDNIVMLWLRTFYDDYNEHVHILVNLDDDYSITAHGVIIVGQEAGYTIVHMPQVQDDKKQGTFLDECVEYAQKLKEQVNAQCIVFNVLKGERALEKKYGFKKARAVMYG